jgi:hypothetical protein
VTSNVSAIVAASSICRLSSSMLEICPRGINKVVIILKCVYDKGFFSHAIIVLTRKANTCVLYKQTIASA